MGTRLPHALEKIEGTGTPESIAERLVEQMTEKFGHRTPDPAVCRMKLEEFARRQAKALGLDPAGCEKTMQLTAELYDEYWTTMATIGLGDPSLSQRGY